MVARAFCAVLFLFILVFYPSCLKATEVSSRGVAQVPSGGGEFRALLIGINNYEDSTIPPLKTAVSDAQAVEQVLMNRYGFSSTIMIVDQQATRKTIDQAFRKMIAESGPEDSLLIYYAGHGDLDRLTNDGWWIPYDAKAGDPTSYLDNTVIQKYIGAMKARHVLLVSDSCYSGTLFGEKRQLPYVLDDQFYEELFHTKSRWGMTSGNKTPVTDAGCEGHSLFAYNFLKLLESNTKRHVTPREIYARIGPIVRNNSEQMPLCLPIRNTGDEGGEFVFINSAPASSAPTGIPTPAKTSSPAGTATQSAPKGPSKPTSKPSPDSLSFQVNYVYRPGGTGELRTINNGMILHSGDYYKVIFTPGQNSYVYIYQVDSTGQVFQLFPMSEFKGVKTNNENPVTKGKYYVLPAPDKSFKLDKRVGKERIYLIASKDPDPELENTYRALQVARQQQNVQKTQEAQEKLSKHFKKRGVDEIVTDRAIGIRWEDSDDIFSIFSKRLENFCEGCVNVVEFVHQ